jgi:hypothetical protein
MVLVLWVTLPMHTSTYYADTHIDTQTISCVS